MFIDNAHDNVFFEIAVNARADYFSRAVFKRMNYLVIDFFGVRSDNQKLIRRFAAFYKQITYETR